MRRYSRLVSVLNRVIKQWVYFTILCFSFYAFTSQQIDPLYRIKVFFVFGTGVFLSRIFYFYALKKYRFVGGNIRKVVVVGENKSIQLLVDLFNEKPQLGYRLKGVFTLKPKKIKNCKHIGTTLKQCKDYVIKEGIDEVYCSSSSLSKDEIDDLVYFAEKNIKVLKFVPDSRPVLNKMVLEYYDFIPVLALRKLPFDDFFNKTLKRAFDILFSLFVIIFILSWLVPILAILIRLESKGSVFFKQTRDGLNGKMFQCYKFRSMRENKQSDYQSATKGDMRVTRVGRIIRKTSIDELPQFYNVLKGDMSVVGPRPHMLYETKKYMNMVDKYMVRHFVKPGITGLAQIRGYRGEIINKHDIESRVRLDIFYIENWTFLLDIKIIIQTVLNAIKGEEKAC